MPRERTLTALLALALAGACAGPTPGDQSIPLASLEQFERRVQPHLDARCASGGCHGRRERPLAFFSAGTYRADPARTYLDEALTPFEIEENARRLSAFALGTSGIDSLAVQKPLATAEGGVWHEGGEIFPDPNDLACLALTQWLDARESSLDGGTP